jgi:ABC-type spermidine/putrescine transport system permease subunit II
VFIYLPMLILVIYSFNASKLVTVWGGWSFKWYVGLLDNTQLMGSVVRSLEIACYTALAAVALGTLAAFVLTRVTRFKGRTLFGGLVTAPLVMPEVITGLSLLLLFVAMAQMIGWPRNVASSPSGSPTPPSVPPMWRWWSRRACASWTCPSKKRPWTWVRSRGRCSS